MITPAKCPRLWIVKIVSLGSQVKVLSCGILLNLACIKRGLSQLRTSFPKINFCPAFKWIKYRRFRSQFSYERVKALGLKGAPVLKLTLQFG
jgi:hypothetical protein